MSVWYHYDVKVLAVDRKATARFFNLDPELDVHGWGDTFELSFGGKNGSPIRLDKIVEQNSDMIFIVSQSIECDTHNMWVERFDKIPNQHQSIHVESWSFSSHDVNKRLLEDYERALPGLAAKHIAGEKGYESFRWSHLLNDFGRVASMLRRSTDYEEMVTLITNDDFVDNDYSHLELEDD